MTAVPLLPLADAAQRLRRRAGRPRKTARAVAHEASAPLPALPSTRDSERAVAALWPVQPRLLGLKAAASYLGVSTWTIRGWLATGRLVRVNLPGAGDRDLERLLVDRLDLDRLVAEGKGP
jgi:hypothetical protein